MASDAPQGEAKVQEKKPLDAKSLKIEIERQLLRPLEDVSVINLVNLFVEYAYISRASDIHIEPGANKLRVRFRIDGVLRDIFEHIAISKELQPEIISRIKVLAGLRTDEHNTPQDGRFKARIENLGAIDVRVSIIPTFYGENAVMRILAETQIFSLEDLGFSGDDLEKVKRAIKRPHGMILANGPTGSGKTTTLYTILKELNTPEVSIITIEDPVEYSIEGTSQIQTNARVGLTFASGLRSILRQDPNIIMVGEIRDQETANIAVNAALTGHLLLSTLHTNDAATTFPRLVDMGVPPFLVASTVNVIMGQRLVRVLCDSCKVEKKLSKEEVASLAEIAPYVKDLKTTKFYAPGGCEKCGGVGYQGRTAIREVLEVDDKIRTLVMSRANAAQIKEAAIKNGMKTMMQDGIEKAAKGITSLAEVLRIITE
ncbi:type II/IV secretion system protein [Candidatus Parcubacteria bacterium]|nr:MAG: type II/IV secretion system protein [Candidatus Parcubacteria bacterium]